MKKFKIVALVLVLIMAITALSGCGEKQNDTETSPKSESTKLIDTITLESCRFTKEVTAIDGEVTGSSYSERDGKIFIDTVILVANNQKELTEDDFTAYTTYDDQRYDFQYDLETSGGVGFDDVSIPAFGWGRVHLFTLLPDEAVDGEKLTVNLKIDGKDYTCEVDGIDNSDALSRKKELKKGDKETLLDGMFEFEVIDCKYTKVLHASDYENSEQYSGSKPFVDCIIKITNNSKESIKDIYGYVKVDDEVMRADNRIETENNTKLKNLFDIGVEVGKTETVHIFAAVEENVDASERVIRFNLGGNCYYIKAE